MMKHIKYCDYCKEEIKLPDTIDLTINFNGSVNIPYIFYQDNKIKKNVSFYSTLTLSFF